MKTNLYQIRLSEKRRRKKSLPRPGVEPESSRPQRDVLTTRPSKHLPTVLLLFFFFFHKVLSLEVTPWRVLPGSLLYNWDKTSPKGEGLRYDAIDNRSDRVYRNTWCNDGRQRTSSRTKDTFGNPYRIWRWETSQRVLLYGLGDPRSQFFFDDVMDGGIPPHPPSDVIRRHVTCLDSYYI